MFLHAGLISVECDDAPGIIGKEITCYIKIHITYVQCSVEWIVPSQSNDSQILQDRQVSVMYEWSIWCPRRWW